MNKAFNILFLIVVVLAGFFYRENVKAVWIRSFNYYFPCKQPITYSLGSFDERFGFSKDEFLSAIKEAENIWEKPISKDLFVYSEKGNLKINLIYDTRQESTVNLQQMGIVVKNNRASYDALKTKYDTMTSDYKKQKITFESQVTAFEARKKAYEAEVVSVNNKGGADKETYERLNAEKTSISAEGASIKLAQDSLNKLVDNINALAVALNQLATMLNVDVKKFNTIGDALGGEFDEGVYRTDASGQEIDIYQFENRAKLVRVLAHELGHALGLDHVDDSKAIMYRLNNGVNESVTQTDLNELKKLCGIE